jgi:hypothetical protein
MGHAFEVTVEGEKEVSHFRVFTEKRMDKHLAYPSSRANALALSTQASFKVEENGLDHPPDGKRVYGSLQSSRF